MALKAWLKTLDGIKDEFKSEYIEDDDGGFKLDVEDSVTDSGANYGLINPDALKGTLTKVRGQLKDALKSNKQFAGIDIEKAREAIEFQENYSGTTSDDYNSKLELMKNDYASKLDTLNKELSDERLRGDQFRIGTAIDNSLIGSADKLTQNAGTFVRNELMGRAKLVDGNIVMHDSNDQPMMSPDLSSGGFMNPVEFLTKMESDPQYAIFFKASQAQGGSGGQGNSGPVNHTGSKLSWDQYSQLSGSEQTEAYNSDPTYYESLQNA